MTEQTVKTIGKTKAIVVSNFKSSGQSVDDKIKNLLRREIDEKAWTKPAKRAILYK